jgi:undecaprenyl pyrophosphate synthase
MKCLVCEKEVNNHGEYKSNINEFCFGYGSRHDLLKFDLTLCDDCVDEKIKKGVIIEMKEVCV